MDPDERLDDETRRHIVAAFDEAVQAGQIVPPDLMNDEGRRRFTEIVRDALLTGSPQSLFLSLANASLWTTYSFGFDLTGSGMKPSDWAGTAKRVSDESSFAGIGSAWSAEGPVARAPRSARPSPMVEAGTPPREKRRAVNQDPRNERTPSPSR